MYVLLFLPPPPCPIVLISLFLDPASQIDRQNMRTLSQIEHVLIHLYHMLGRYCIVPYLFREGFFLLDYVVGIAISMDKERRKKVCARRASKEYIWVSNPMHNVSDQEVSL